MKILAIGDSLTLGEIGYSYLHFLDRTDREVINRGINGDTTEGVSDRLFRMLDSGRYDDVDVLIIFVGINDLLFFDYSFTDELFESTYSEMVEKAKEKISDVILVSLPLAQSYFSCEEKSERRNGIIREIAEKHGCLYADIFSAQKKNEDRHLTYDGVHFTELSARLLAEIIEKCLQEF